MSIKTALAVVFLTGVCMVAAAAEPTMQDVYRAANSGRLGQAETMMAEVLRNHPNSARAHYVAAEVYAREGRQQQARAELTVAQTIDPKLTFATPASVGELRAQLAKAPGSGQFSAAGARSAFPIGWIALLAGAGLLLWFMFRRRAVAAPVPAQYSGAMSGGPYANPYGAPPGPMGGGLGSSLATGLAMGAGVVAGEEIVRHFVDGDRRGPIAPQGFEGNGEGSNRDLNPDMGGNNFGVSDGSWDDGGGDFGSGGDGGGDWS